MIKKTTMLQLIALLFVSANAMSQVISLDADITLGQSVGALDPSTPANASGSATMKYNTNSNTLSWEINFSGLSGAVIASHFHGPASPGQNTGVQVDIGGNSGGLTSPIIGSAVITDAQASDLLTSRYYINMHTALNAGGEIRGQVYLTPVIIPTLSILNIALLILALMAMTALYYRNNPLKS